MSMDKWVQFIDSLARTGGTILMLFVLAQVSFFLTFMSMPKAEDVMMLSVGALLGVLKGEGRNSENSDNKLG